MHYKLFVIISFVALSYSRNLQADLVQTPKLRALHSSLLHQAARRLIVEDFAQGDYRLTKTLSHIPGDLKPLLNDLALEVSYEVLSRQFNKIAAKGKAVTAEEVNFILNLKNHIKEALLHQVFNQWQDNLPSLLTQTPSLQENWHAGKAYVAGFIACFVLHLSSAKIASFQAGYNSAWEAAVLTAPIASKDPAYIIAYNDAWSETWPKPWQEAYHAAYDQATAQAAQFGKSQTVQWLAHSCKDAEVDLGLFSFDLAELFVLQWMHDHGFKYLKQAFIAAYAHVDAAETIAQAKEKIFAVLNQERLQASPFVQSIQKELWQLEVAIADEEARRERPVS